MNFVLADAINALIGGALIGCAAALLLLGNGRIAGISGIAAVLTGNDKSQAALEKLAFLLGLIIAPALYVIIVGKPEIGLTSNVLLLVVAGLLVGLGTRLGNGCTSGHGICGLSRFSTRSLVSVLTFVGVAMVVASLISIVMGG